MWLNDFLGRHHWDGICLVNGESYVTSEGPVYRASPFQEFYIELKYHLTGKIRRTKSRIKWHHLTIFQHLTVLKSLLGVPKKHGRPSSNRPRHSWAICRVIRIARWRRSVDGSFVVSSLVSCWQFFGPCCFFCGLVGWLGSGWLLFGPVVFSNQTWRFLWFLRVLVTCRSWVNLLQPRSSFILSSPGPWSMQSLGVDPADEATWSKMKPYKREELPILLTFRWQLRING